MPTIYTPKLLFFPIPNDRTDIAIESFIHGLRSTFQAIPLLTGTIKAIPHEVGQVGTLAITSPWRTVDEIFHIKDLRKSKKYNYFELRNKGFPPTSLPMWDFLNLNFFVNSDCPVMHVQITLIQGGVILAPCLHHSFTDGIGSTSIVQIWAACCRSDILLDDQLSGLWQQVTLLEGYEKAAIEDFPDYKYKEKTPYINQRSYVDNANQHSPSWRSWVASNVKKKAGLYVKPMLMKLVIFSVTKYQSLFYSTRLIYFSCEDLAKLKENVKAAGDKSDHETWISTMDALSALLFCCVAQSRQTTKRSHSSFPSEISSLFLTSVNVRKQCQLPSNYIRNMWLPCTIGASLDELTPSPRNLARQAYNLRARLRGFDTAYVRRVASMIRSVEDVSRIVFAAKNSQMDGLAMTSWREQGFWDSDWGPHIGAKCERVRICNYFYDGLAVVFPEYGGSKIDGGIEMVLGLRKDAMRKMEENEFFNQYAQWR